MSFLGLSGLQRAIVVKKFCKSRIYGAVKVKGDLRSAFERICNPAEPVTLKELRLLASLSGKSDGIGADERVLIARKRLRPESFATAPADVRRFLAHCQEEYGKSTGATTVELVCRAQADDEMAWEILLKWKKPFLLSMVNQVFGGLRRSRSEELLQAASLGFCEAVRRFDPDCGVKLETFAQWHVRRALLEEKKVMNQQHISQESAGCQKGKDIGAHDAAYRQFEAHHDVRALISRANLSTRERSVIIHSFGLEDGLERSLTEVASTEGVSVPYIFKLKKSVLEKLKVAI